MEDYPAFDERPADKCLADVEQCDCYVLIVAMRYGFQPGTDNPKKLSITHLEYEQALRSSKPCLVFLLDEDHPWPRKHEDKDIHARKSKIRAFRKHVGDKHGIRTFTTADSLASTVLSALTAHHRKQGTAKPTISHAAIRAGYLDWLRGDCARVVLLGLDLKDSQNLRLGQVYVPTLTVSKLTKEKGDRSQLMLFLHYDLLLHRIGAESLYVPGAPGAGKSTFCNWLALAAAGAMESNDADTPEEFRERYPDALRGKFPLLCRLREWSGHEDCLGGNGNWTRAQIENALSCWLDTATPGNLTSAAWREELEQGNCLLIFDGVDEVPETHGAHYPRKNLLAGLADALPAWIKLGNRIILTSRPYGV